MKFNNPIIPGFYPDPSICRSGDNYFLVTSSFEYFPGVPIFQSKDLVNWNQIGHCLTNPNQLPLDGCWASGGIWAPTIRYNQGTFYMTTTNTTGGGHFYVMTDDPAGAWSEPIWVEGEGFDASLFFDDDGRVFFQWYVYPDGIYQTEIEISTGKHITRPRVVWEGTGGRSPEGPHLYKIDGVYYLLAAEGGTEDGHMITLARAQNVWGPWEPHPNNPILSHRSLDNPIQTTGHGDLIQAPDGTWWLVCLGTRPVGYPRHHILGRETFLSPVVWQNGWPIVGNQGTIDLEVDAPLPPPKTWDETEALRDDFDTASLATYWNWLRNPVLERYSLMERPGWLRLKGGGESLNDEASPTFLGRRQQHFDCRITARLDFNPEVENEEAGLVVMGDNRHHYEIGVSRQNGARIVFVRRKIGSLQAIVAVKPIPDGYVTLQIVADQAWYKFGFAIEGDSICEIAKGETRYLCTESGAAVFTGTYFGMYATGRGKSCQAPADFDWFNYEVVHGNES